MLNHISVCLLILSEKTARKLLVENRNKAVANIDLIPTFLEFTSLDEQHEVKNRFKKNWVVTHYLIRFLTNGQSILPTSI